MQHKLRRLNRPLCFQGMYHTMYTENVLLKNTSLYIDTMK